MFHDGIQTVEGPVYDNRSDLRSEAAAKAAGRVGIDDMELLIFIALASEKHEENG